MSENKFWIGFGLFYGLFLLLISFCFLACVPWTISNIEKINTFRVTDINLICNAIREGTGIKIRCGTDFKEFDQIFFTDQKRTEEIKNSLVFLTIIIFTPFFLGFFYWAGSFICFYFFSAFILLNKDFENKMQNLLVNGKDREMDVDLHQDNQASASQKILAYASNKTKSVNFYQLFNKLVIRRALFFYLIFLSGMFLFKELDYNIQNRVFEKSQQFYNSSRAAQIFGISSRVNNIFLEYSADILITLGPNEANAYDKIFGQKGYQLFEIFYFPKPYVGKTIFLTFLLLTSIYMFLQWNNHNKEMIKVISKIVNEVRKQTA